jgi:hypothetical protein
MRERFAIFFLILRVISASLTLGFRIGESSEFPSFSITSYYTSNGNIRLESINHFSSSARDSPPQQRPQVAEYDIHSRVASFAQEHSRLMQPYARALLCPYVIDVLEPDQHLLLCSETSADHPL